MPEQDGNNSNVAYIVPMGKGLDSFVYREIEQLRSMGLQIILFATKFKKRDIYAPKPEWRYFTLSLGRMLLLSPLLLLKMLLHPMLSVHAAKNRSIVELMFALYYAPKMKQTNVRQIHCHFGDRKLFIGYYCKRLMRLPLSVTIHSHELHTNPNECMFRIALQECDRIFAISQLGMDILHERYAIPENILVLNRLFVDMSIWSDQSPIRVLTVGRLEEQKGFQYLFQAARLMSEIDIEFVIVGFGPLDVRALARAIGVEDKVVFFDKLGQRALRLLYQSCDIYCLPSITHPTQGMEGVPVVLMEAMACGLPVVATSAGAVPEIVRHILVEEKSPEALAEALMKLAADPQLRRQYAIENRQIVESTYSVENVRVLFDEFNNLVR